MMGSEIDYESEPLVDNIVLPPSANTNRYSRSVQDVINEFGFTTIHAFYLITLGTIAMGDSMQTAYVAIILPHLKCEWDMTPTVQGFTTGIIFAGTGFGGIMIGNFSDKYGRKPTALTSTIILVMSMALSSLANSVPVFIIFSTISGMCCGGSLSIAYTYWAEVSSEEHRGIGVMVISMMWNGGLFLSNFIAYFIVNRIGWKMYVVMMSLPMIVPIIFLWFLPESPKFLNVMKKKEMLLKSIKRITSIPEEYLKKITFEEEECEDFGAEKSTFCAAIANICSKDLRISTFKVLFVYICLQIFFKGILYLYTDMISVNYCDMGTSILDSGDSSMACAVLTDADLINGMLLSIAFFPSTVCAVFFSKWFGDLKTLRFFSVGGFIGMSFLLICMGKFLMYAVGAIVIFCIAAMSVVLFIILPQMYPTVARNSGFGLVDGLGKIFASVAIFGITAMLNYTIRACIGFFMAIALIQIVSSFLFSFTPRGVTAQSNTEVPLQ